MTDLKFQRTLGVQPDVFEHLNGKNLETFQNFKPVLGKRSEASWTPNKGKFGGEFFHITFPSRYFFVQKSIFYHLCDTFFELCKNK